MLYSRPQLRAILYYWFRFSLSFMNEHGQPKAYLTDFIELGNFVEKIDFM